MTESLDLPGRVICPSCKSDSNRVIDSRCRTGAYVRRRRLCSCGDRFTTIEIALSPGESVLLSRAGGIMSPVMVSPHIAHAQEMHALRTQLLLMARSLATPRGPYRLRKAVGDG
jgi:hypothetical protein